MEATFLVPSEPLARGAFESPFKMHPASASRGRSVASISDKFLDLLPPALTGQTTVPCRRTAEPEVFRQPPSGRPCIMHYDV
jgi:hypothetical protein